MKINNVKTLAKKGEELATLYLKSLGCNILSSNFKGSRGEIDLVALYQTELIVAEVKTRSKHDYKTAENSITKSKKKNLTYTAMEFLQKHQQYSKCSVRFDLIVVFYFPDDDTYSIKHYKDAFKPEFSQDSE